MLTKPRTILILVGIFLAGGVSGVFLAPFVRPREQRQPPPPQVFFERHRERLEKALDLTTEQRAQVAVLLQQTSEEMTKLRHESLRDGMQRMKALNGKITAILTPEQRVKFEKFQRDQLERMQRHQMDRDQRHPRRPGERAPSGDMPPPPPDLGAGEPPPLPPPPPAGK